MAVPTFEEFLYPVLFYLQDEQPTKIRDIKEHLKVHFSLTTEDLSVTTRSGKVTQFNDRVSWSRQYLHRAKFIEVLGKGIWKITDIGKDYLSKYDYLRIVDLMEYKDFAEFANGSSPKESKEKGNLDICNHDEELTPTDKLENAYETIQNDLANDLLTRILDKSPEFFEHLVVDLLLKMGYGDSSDYSNMVTPFSHDGGIDGIIPQDRLGLDKIYIQAKRYAKDNVVSRPTLQSFSGALSGKNATKGIFITTSSYSNDAKKYVENLAQKIVLIDGQQLVRYMIEFNVGVSVKNTYEVKRIDLDYFEEQ